MQDWVSDYPYRVITGLAAGDIGPARHCRYPVGGKGAETRFCGRPSQRGTSYCPRHLDRCVEVAPTEKNDAAQVTHVTSWKDTQG